MQVVGETITDRFNATGSEAANRIETIGEAITTRFESDQRRRRVADRGHRTGGQRTS